MITYTLEKLEGDLYYKFDCDECGCEFLLQSIGDDAYITCPRCAVCCEIDDLEEVA